MHFYPQRMSRFSSIKIFTFFSTQKKKSLPFKNKPIPDKRFSDEYNQCSSITGYINKNIGLNQLPPISYFIKKNLITLPTLN